MAHKHAKLFLYVTIHAAVIHKPGPGGVRFSGKWNSIWMSELTRKVDDGQGYFYQGGGARGALLPLNFDNPKRSKIVYVACGTIIRCIAAAAK